MEAIEKKFSKVDNYPNLFINEGSEIDYSDGDIEKKILDFLKNNPESDYQDWSKQIIDWPTEYHFSHIRTNLFAPISFNVNQKVLELGGGTGILTHYISQRVSEIVTVEGSLQRAKCISHRCRKFDNVKIIASNFEDANLIETFGENSFDVITLIGVLEYTNKYFRSQNGIQDLLRACKDLLKPDGELIIAIENKLGIKYLLGWEEDHVSIPYYGVENLYKTKDVITFGLTELNKVLENAGFKNNRTLLPFPDYKMPKVIIDFNKTTGEQEKSLFKNLLNNVSFRNYTGKPVPKIKLQGVIDNLIDNNLIKDLSNSFLTISKKELEVKPQQKFNNIAFDFSSAGKVGDSLIYLKDLKGKIFYEKYHDRLNIDIRKEGCVSNLNEQKTFTNDSSHGVQAERAHKFGKQLSSSRSRYENQFFFSEVYLKENVITKIGSNEIIENELKFLKLLEIENQFPKIIRSERYDDFGMIQMEEIAGFTLADLVNEYQFWSKKNIRNFIKDALTILTILNEKNILHRDIRPENLILQKGNTGYILKLIDFGWAIKSNENENNLCPHGLGGLYKFKEGEFSDAWSMGKIITNYFGMFSVGKKIAEELQTILPSYYKDEIPIPQIIRMSEQFFQKEQNFNLNDMKWFLIKKNKMIKKLAFKYTSVQNSIFN